MFGKVENFTLQLPRQERYKLCPKRAAKESFFDFNIVTYNTDKYSKFDFFKSL